MGREKSIRVSEREREIVKMTNSFLYDGDLDMGNVIERGCKALLKDEAQKLEEEIREEVGY